MYFVKTFGKLVRDQIHEVHAGFDIPGPPGQQSG